MDHPPPELDTSTTPLAKKQKTEEKKEIKKDEVYCDPKATVVIHSSDGVEFRLFDYHCKANSSVLCDLLESHKESIIPLSEKSRILRAVFDVMTLPEGRLETCQFKTLAASDMERILLTLDKYGVDKGGLALLRAWKKVVPEHPFDAFVVACKCGKEDFAQVALSHFTPCIEFEEDTQYEGMNSKTVKMRPWDEGGQWLKSQISAAAFASYTAACFAGCFIAYESSAIDEEGRCWAHEDAEIDWKKAGEAFRL